MGKKESQAGHGCTLNSAEEMLRDEIDEDWERERFEACETVSAWSTIGSSIASNLRLSDEESKQKSEFSRHARILFMRRENESDCGIEANGFWDA